MIKQAATTQTILPVILAIAVVAAIVADATAVPPVLVVPAVLAVPAIPETILFGGFWIMIENYSADNLKVLMPQLPEVTIHLQRNCLRQSGR